jgi:hypothetical protein
VVRGGLERAVHGGPKGRRSWRGWRRWCSGFWAIGKQNGNGMGRVGVSAALEPEKRGRGGVRRQCHSDGELSLGGSSGRGGMRRGKRARSQKGRARAAVGLEIDAWGWIMAGGGERRPEMAGGGAAAEEQRSRGDARGGRRETEVRGT